MRIISKFHDYYDCMMKTMMDPNVIFIRKQECPEHDNIKFFGAEEWTCEKNTYFLTREIIGYCGRLIPIIRVQTYALSRSIVTDFFYTFDEIKNSFKDVNGIEHLRDWFENFSCEWQSNLFTNKNIRLFLGTNKKVDRELIKTYFLKYNAPLFHIFFLYKAVDSHLVINPSFSDQYKSNLCDGCPGEKASKHSHPFHLLKPNFKSHSALSSIGCRTVISTS